MSANKVIFDWRPITEEQNNAEIKRASRKALERLRKSARQKRHAKSQRKNIAERRSESKRVPILLEAAEPLSLADQNKKATEDIFKERYDKAKRFSGSKCENVELLQAGANRSVIEAKIQNLKQKGCVDKGHFCVLLGLYLFLENVESSDIADIIHRDETGLAKTGISADIILDTLENHGYNVSKCIPEYSKRSNVRIRYGYNDLQRLFLMPTQRDMFIEQIKAAMSKENTITLIGITNIHEQIGHIACIANFEGTHYIVDPSIYDNEIIPLTSENLRKYFTGLEFDEGTSYIKVFFAESDKKPSTSNKRYIDDMREHHIPMASLGPIKKEIRKPTNIEPSRKRRRTHG